MIDIRLLRLDDYEHLINIWSNTENLGLSNADSQINLEIFLNRNPGLSFVAESNDRIIGTILGGHDGRRGFIYHLAVDKDFRNQGIGKLLVTHCLDVIASLGIERCHIHVYANNQAGIDFWQKYGWYTRPELVLLSRDLSNSE